MFGSSLLAAPVFKESGEVDYYLPKGTWVNLITGETREGGTWYREVYGYHSMPLMVKENTILPVGKNDREAEYDFADGVTLLLSVFADGKEADVEIPDCRGKIVMKAHAECRDGEILVHIEGGNDNYTVKSLGGQKFKMV